MSSLYKLVDKTSSLRFWYWNSYCSSYRPSSRGANCSKISSILKKNYGFSEKCCIFLDKFACPLPEKFVNKSKELIGIAILDREKSLRV